MTFAARSLKSNYTIHNDVSLIRGGKLYFDLVEKLIDGATETLHFQTYIFDGDETGMRIAKALLRAAQRKVKVFLLLDGFASQNFPEKLMVELKTAGVHFRWFGLIIKNRYLYFGRRLHHKVIVADAAKCLIGGLNISNRYNDLPGSAAWLDWALLVEGEVALKAHEACERRMHRRWISWRRKLMIKPQSLKVSKKICRVRLRINDWIWGKNEITKCYSQMLRQAKSEVIIMSSYFMPGGEFRRNLRLAAKRGVKVKVILTGVSDIRLAKEAERYLYPWLLRHGIEIFEYTKNVLHGKLAYCDEQWLTVGSYNLNDLSAKASIEMNLEVLDIRVARLAGIELRNIIAEDCIQITKQDEIKIRFFQKVWHKAAYNIFRLLLFIFTFYFRRQKA